MSRPSYCMFLFVWIVISRLITTVSLCTVHELRQLFNSTLREAASTDAILLKVRLVIADKHACS